MGMVRELTREFNQVRSFRNQQTKSNLPEPGDVMSIRMFQSS